MIVSDADIEKAYEAVGGYVPGDEWTDNGAVEIDVLKFWQKAGDRRVKIGAFVSVDQERAASQAPNPSGGAYRDRSPVTGQTQEIRRWCPTAVSSATARRTHGAATPSQWGPTISMASQ